MGRLQDDDRQKRRSVQTFSSACLVLYDTVGDASNGGLQWAYPLRSAAAAVAVKARLPYAGSAGHTTVRVIS